jgi:hypothetical protein
MKIISRLAATGFAAIQAIARFTPRDVHRADHHQLTRLDISLDEHFAADLLQQLYRLDR